MKKRKYIDLRTPEGRKQFYQSPEWNQTRKVVLTLQPYCQECLKEGVTTIGNEIDHIIDLKEAPERCIDVTNLQTLCKEHHGRKTMLENLNAIHPVFTSSHKKWNFNMNI